MTMALMLVMGGLISPLIPVVSAATDENIAAARQATDSQSALANAQPVDTDGDGILDPDDSCPDVANLGTDWNMDGVDDACDPQPQVVDSDMDGIPDADDSCPDVANLGTESNMDGIDDACDPLPLEDEVVPATISIALYWCPAGTDVLTPTDGYGLQGMCGEQGNPVQVSLVSADASSPQQDASVNAFPGSVNFIDLLVGDWNLFFNTTDLETQALFCEGYHSHGNTKPYGRYFLAQTSVPGYPIDTLNDEDITCVWFGVPQMMGTMDAGYGDFQLMKYACEDTPPMGADLTWYRTNCTDTMNGVQFILDTSTVDIQADTADNGTDGSITFGGVEVGTYPLTEETSTAFTPLAVFCATVPLNTTPQDSDYSPASLTGSSIDVTIVSEQVVDCYWFNQMMGHSLTIYKWECPAGTLYGQADDYYSAECATEQAGVPFDITDDNGTQSTTSDTNGRQIDNLVGEISIQETIPSGFGNPVVYCQLLNDADSTLYPSDSGLVTLPPAVDDDYQCFWYNIPDTDPVLWIYKYECPDSVTDNLQDLSVYQNECLTEQSGVEFTVDGDNGSQMVTSVAGGVQIPGLTGIISIAETVPDGYGVPAAFCQVSAAEGPQSQQLGGPYATVQFSGDEDAYCWFYNLPDHSTTVTIYKWECPEGTLYGQTDSYYSAECATEQPGVPFTITDDNRTQNTTSDTNGRQIDGLVGEFTITEDVPSSFGNPAIFCQLLNDATSTDYSSTSPSVTLPANSTDDYQCWFYNIPEPTTSVTIYKWICPVGTDLGQTHSYYGAECATEQPGVPFTITDDTGTQNTTSDTNGRQIDGLVGEFTITEDVPSGFGNPAIFCQLLNDANSTDYSSSSPSVTLPANSTDDYQCWFYNIPQDPSTVDIYKWECPEGSVPEPTVQWHQDNCVTPMNGVEFTLTDTSGVRSMNTAGGMVSFTDVPTGPIQISETIPSGYSNQVFLVCQFTYADGTGTGQYSPSAINGTYNTSIDQPGSYFRCDWYNYPVGPGEITVYKWTCPEGYDRTAWGANPTVDCTQATNGITFQLTQPSPNPVLQSDTGDSINGAVYFGGLEPGDYTLEEILTPEQSAEMKDVFVWECYGLNSSAVHPMPLSVGPTFNFTIVGGDNITCNWFNVPMPQYGWMVVSKYNCTTQTYVKDVYCYTNQTGQEFNLQMWVNGTGWSTVQSGVTDVSGKLMFSNLDAGAYRLVEPNKQACMIKSSNITSGGFIGVNTGEETTVYVFNCQAPPPPQTGKTPTKYPNTGVAPEGDQQDQRLPGLELAGIVTLLGMQLTRRRMAAGAALAAASTLPLVKAQPLQPLTADPTVAPGTPAPELFGCGGTPEAWTQAEGTPVVDPCNRGAIPMQMRIPVIEVDAPMEFLEIIDGAMQQPTGDTHITWYKESSRLGEVGNGIYAAHVNWWGNPEGIFFRLESLQEGDVVEIDGDNGETYLYQVKWMQNFPSNEEPPDEALGLTEEVAITLITCGGEWSSELSEYDHRTLVRAVLLE